ncbi:Cas1p-domain-containing protein [Calocera viscosa TUFC12733]|uniref:Cas1p-domain-containing protein n=1 Tax=Calocera viscosa (strain TUFC12733) TaxID=1330018 RepID=A0A167RFK4_CALVF|nr:Cas1p-domain-containing protein [Calocera viscosa TUFC12733]
MAGPSKKSAQHLWLQYAAALTIAVTLLTGVLRLLLIGRTDWADRDHCHKLVNEGRWLDKAFRNWQPEGCMMNMYTSKTVSPCLKNRRVLFLGDSTVRQLFFTFAHIVDPSLPGTTPNDGGKHVDHTLVSGTQSMSLEFLWDPYLNSTSTREALSVPARGQPPALLVLGSGLWYLRNPASGGLPAWEKMVDSTFSLLSSASARAEKGGQPAADEIVFLPVEEPVHAKLNPERQRTIHPADVEVMNSDLVHRVTRPGGWWSAASAAHDDHPLGEVVIPSVFNELLDPSQTDDGLHFSQGIMAMQIQLLLNHRCNKVLPPKFPWDRTCCRPYPWPSIVQGLVILCIAGWGLVAKLYVSKQDNRPVLKSLFPSGETQSHLAIFGLAILLAFLADRTPLWDKEQKQFDPWQFGGILGIFLLLGLGTMHRADKDLGFLNRDQTDEWKGWMQIVILAYHYYGGSKISGIYNPVRVLVAAYLFMTGYGHFTFYYRKADYSFLRIAQVLVRLNLLTVVLAYTMDTDYLFYYFAPLVSFWFLIIYFTMLAGAKYNDQLSFLIPKMLLSGGLVALATHQPFIMQAVFDVLHRVFRLPWNAREWDFRVGLDLWIVWLGAFTALAVLKFNQHRLADHPQWTTAKRAALGLSVVTLAWFFWFELTRETKFVYNAYHPYVSFLPIAAFFILRNATPVLRSATSRLYTFVGKISLETFIMQYHIWLAADTKGILVVFPRTRWRSLNLVIATLMFVYISWNVAAATGTLTSWILGAPEKKPVLPTQRVAGTSAPPTRTQEPENVPLTSAEAEKEPDVLENGHAHGVSPSSRGQALEFLRPVMRGWKEDVRIRLGIILLGMWVLNLMWPSA